MSYQTYIKNPNIFIKIKRTIKHHHNESIVDEYFSENHDDCVFKTCKFTKALSYTIGGNGTASGMWISTDHPLSSYNIQDKNDLITIVDETKRLKQEYYSLSFDNLSQIKFENASSDKGELLGNAYIEGYQTISNTNNGVTTEEDCHHYGGGDLTFDESKNDERKNLYNSLCHTGILNINFSENDGNTIEGESFEPLLINNDKTKLSKETYQNKKEINQNYKDIKTAVNLIDSLEEHKITNNTFNETGSFSSHYESTLSTTCTSNRRKEFSAYCSQQFFLASDTFDTENGELTYVDNIFEEDTYPGLKLVEYTPLYIFNKGSKCNISYEIKLTTISRFQTSCDTSNTTDNSATENTKENTFLNELSDIFTTDTTTTAVTLIKDPDVQKMEKLSDTHIIEFAGDDTYKSEIYIYVTIEKQI